jgi:hypothetical protein
MELHRFQNWKLTQRQKELADPITKNKMGPVVGNSQKL